MSQHEGSQRAHPAGSPETAQRLGNGEGERDGILRSTGSPAALVPSEIAARLAALEVEITAAINDLRAWAGLRDPYQYLSRRSGRPIIGSLLVAGQYLREAEEGLRRL